MKKLITQATILLIASFLTVGCGAGGSSSTNSSTSSNAVDGSKNHQVTINWDFTNSNTITTDVGLVTSIAVDEGVINLAHITSDYVLTLGGDDAILFDLNTTSEGQSLSFKQATNFDLPIDNYQNNTYMVALKLEHENGFFTIYITFNIERYKVRGNFSKVSKTGQSISALDFDDAYYNEGLDKNLTRLNEMVTDNLSGLIWQDNNESNATAQAVDFSTAPAYCANLSLGGLTWRVPTIRELNSITNYSTSELVKINSIFVYKNSQYNYMSSNDYNATHSFRYNYGTAISDVVLDGAGALIRCVSGTNNSVVLTADLNRDGSNEIVTDSKNNLMWQDEFDTMIRVRTWDESINYCESLTLNGYTDWRLPQIFELGTLIDNTRIHSTYWYASASPYWSSTSNPTDSSYATTIDMSSNSIFEGTAKTLLKHARCVRDFQ